MASGFLTPLLDRPSERHSDSDENEFGQLHHLFWTSYNGNVPLNDVLVIGPLCLACAAA